MSTELPERKPFMVRCADCEHSWSAFYTPILVSKLKNFKKVVCPMCAGKKIFCGDGKGKLGSANDKAE